MTRIVAFHHVQLAIPANSEAECRRFWHSTLGWDEVPKPPALAARGGCWFRSGPVEIHLGVVEKFTPAARAHPAIAVDGLAELAAILESHRHPVEWTSDLPGFARFYTDDPFGNRLEFLERDDSAQVDQLPVDR